MNIFLNHEIPPYGKRFGAPIDTAQQLADKNMEWGGTNIAWTFSILDATEVLKCPTFKYFLSIFLNIRLLHSNKSD